jgi:colanic acid/amylovoran biosynthesis glycosyltransferase
MGVNLAPYLVRQRPPAVAFDASHPMQLISVARLARGKGHVYALEALAKLRQQGLFWRYSLVGAGPDTDWIREQVVRLNLADWVTFCGTQDEAAVREMLFSHHLLLLTSVGTFEAAPVCVMEAMASAMPTVTSHIGGTPDMIRHEVDGFLVPQADVEAIVEAINRVYHDPAVLQQMGLQARIRAIAEFDARAQALKLWEALPTPEATAD